MFHNHGPATAAPFHVTLHSTVDCRHKSCSVHYTCMDSYSAQFRFSFGPKIQVLYRAVRSCKPYVLVLVLYRTSSATVASASRRVFDADGGRLYYIIPTTTVCVFFRLRSTSRSERHALILFARTRATVHRAARRRDVHAFVSSRHGNLLRQGLHLASLRPVVRAW